ncbi:peptidylprolyl isomerase [Adlercreutzia sp. ZJ138]|uniref:peptidylprolyl isomerase n=1 Tax=Adlercreutzia sp. ZJ138 TaxID=2709405 RepID=UPI0013E9F019|nr:peptidylprolyl isomerase [Adlercreutzia sp. ZJ138]
MEASKVLRTVTIGAVSTVLALSLAACSDGKGSSEGDKGSVAATVNGTEIYENIITDYIASIRDQMGLTEDEKWGEWLVSYNYTPESVRSDVIDSHVSRELMVQGANEKGITVDAAEVDEYVNSMKQYYDSDEAWQSALEQAGMDEEYYRNEIEMQLKTKKLQESFATDEEPSEEEMLSTCQMYATSYDGARKSSNILFDADDKETAQEVLDKINAGEFDFAEAAKEYSIDTGSAENGGDVGWDCMNTFVEEYETALKALEKDQVSDLVESQYGWHIIKCTDVFVAPEEVTSVDQIPADWVETIKSSLKQQAQSEAFNAWLEEYKKSADIVINDMPEGLPYDIDLTPYQEAAAANAEDTATEGDSATPSEQPAEGAEGDTAAADGTTDGESGDSGSDTASSEGDAAEGDAAAATDSTDAAAPASTQPTEAS